MGDCKCLYLQTGHSPWQVNESPFLLCKCKRGFGVDSQCKLTSDGRYRELQNSSFMRMQMMTGEMRSRGKQYTVKEHRVWVDKFNNGVSHLCVLPLTYDISNVLFDMFHAKTNIVKIILGHIRDEMADSYENIEQFSSVLYNLDNWGDYEVSPWISGDGLARLKGLHTKSFTENAEVINEVLKRLLSSNIVTILYDALVLFKWISAFLNLLLIDEYKIAQIFLPDNPNIFETSTRCEIATAMIDAFKAKTKKFYKIGYDTFMTKIVPGDKENF